MRIFADLALSKRLERAEMLCGSKFVDARSRISPESKAAWIEVAGARAMFDGPASPLTQTFGLGLFEQPTSTDLDRIEAFFLNRGAPVIHEVSPHAGVELAQLLVGRGYKPVELTSVMYQPLPAPVPRTPVSPAIKTRIISPDEQQAWADLSARGWISDLPPEFTEFLHGMGRVLAACEDMRGLFAEIDGQPIATGVLWCHEGVGMLGGASTIPEGRKKGAQQALLTARLYLAHQSGCDLAMMCAAPGSSSQHNAERRGFRIAYTRTKWQLSRGR
jgi:hypothetical protein